MDRVSAAVRSKNMSHIRSQDTRPEIIVRKYLHSAGFRYRLHVSKLPGKPDLVFPRRNICVFVHGCFWHGCPKCRDGRRTPQTNQSYWQPKIAANKQRDRVCQRELRRAGWRVLVIWECEAVNPAHLCKLRRAIAASKVACCPGVLGSADRNRVSRRLHSRQSLRSTT
jgi:DNA mismatch endonuclease, patch repair protein